jgi:hypothetical protein
MCDPSQYWTGMHVTENSSRIEELANARPKSIALTDKSTGKIYSFYR